MQQIIIAPGGHTGWHSHPGLLRNLSGPGKFSMPLEVSAANCALISRGQDNRIRVEQASSTSDGLREEREAFMGNKREHIRRATP
jgi:hypothetical protein